MSILASLCAVTAIIEALILIKLAAKLSDAKNLAAKALLGHATLFKRFAQLSNDYMSLLSCLPSDVKIPRRLGKDNPNARIRYGE